MKSLPPGARVLLVKLSSLGDLFHALPLVRVLKREAAARIDWVTQPEYAGLVRCFEDVGEVIRFPRRGSPGDLLAYVREVRRRSYDCVLDVQGLLKSACAGRVARAAWRLGPSFQREGARFLYDAVAGEPDRQRHAVEEVLDAARYWGLPTGTAEFPVRFPAVDLPGEPPHLGVVPCSRWPSKNAPAEVLARLVRATQAETGGTVHLLGGAGDRPVCEQVARLLPGCRVVNHAGRSGLLELGGMLQAMERVVTVDSGPMHMAAALGCTVTALFGPTDPVRTGPFGAGHAILRRTDLPCMPCFQRICPLGHHACMEGAYF